MNATDILYVPDHAVPYLPLWPVQELCLKMDRGWQQGLTDKACNRPQFKHQLPASISESVDWG